VLHGHPLYDLPNRPPYTLTLYNFGFYRFYASVMRLLGADDEGLLLWPRVLTAAGGTLGAVTFDRLARRLAPPVGALERCALGGLCFILWFGTQFFSWWPFDVRPDIWSLTLALGGLALVLRALERDSRRLLLAASLVFWLAWTFKQSTVWTFAGSLVAVTVFGRRAAKVLPLAVPFCVLAAGALVSGGHAYRVSLLVAPALSAWHASVMFEVLSRSLLQNLWPFGFGVFAYLVWAWKRKQPDAEPLERSQAVLLIVGAVALVFGGISTGRVGANKNYLFEAYIALALASWVALVRSARRPEGALSRVVSSLLLVPWVALPLLQVVKPGRFGRTTLCTAEDTRRLENLAEVVAKLPKPLYADHDVFSQPWQATGNRYPAFVMDSTWADVAVRAHFLDRDYLDRLFRTGGFASGLFYESDPEVAQLVKRGALCRPLEQPPFELPRIVCELRGAVAPPATDAD
jgi:hypothetical protein